MQRVFCRINLRVTLCSKVKEWKFRNRSESECDKRERVA